MLKATPVSSMRETGTNGWKSKTSMAVVPMHVSAIVDAFCNPSQYPASSSDGYAGGLLQSLVVDVWFIGPNPTTGLV